jgi:hypothetical protein
MNLFINHSIEEKNNEQIITLYIDKRFANEEFGIEFLTKRKERSLEKQAKEYIKSNLPNFKGGVIKIALRTTILVTIPAISFAEAADSDETFNIEYTIESEPDEVSEEIPPSIQPHIYFI